MDRKYKHIVRSKPTAFQELLLRAYYYNGFNSVEAYKTARKLSDNKKGKIIPQTAWTTVYKAQRENPGFVKKLQQEMNEKLEPTRKKLISQLEDVSKSYFELLDLAKSGKKFNETQKLKFHRLKQIITTSDLSRAIHLIAKLTGAYEPERVEVNTTYDVSFGEDPLENEPELQ